MPNCYVGLDSFKRRAQISGADKDAQLLDLLRSASRFIENECNGDFFPTTATRLYRWPPRGGGSSYILWLNRWLISVSALQTKAQDSSPTTIAAADFFLEPQQDGPPYTRIEIDQSSSSALESGETQQRSISVAGDWGHSAQTETAGALAEALDISETGVDVTDSSLIEIGNTILIESERMYVSAKSLLDTTANLSADLTATKSQTSVTVSDGTKVKAGEIVTIGSERMYVESISAAVLTVIRAYDGSTLAAHTGAVDVYAPRTLTVTRAVNGSVAATHADTTAITRYVAPDDVRLWCLAEAIGDYNQEIAGWGRAPIVSTAASPFDIRTLAELRKKTKDNYYRPRWGAI